ncbi:MAG TPA: hypothetical protein VKZ67_03430, partial [Natronosporangium sp.]|nr:hypothetical protein [Natronosporangium sp.]
MPTPRSRRATTHRSPRRATPPSPPPGTRLSGPGRHRRPRGRRREVLWTVLAAVALVLAGSTAVVLTRDPTTGPVSDAGPAHDAGLVTASPAPAASRTGASDTPTPATPTPSESPADPPVGDPPTARGEPPVPQEEPSDPMPTREPDPGRGGQRSGPGESLLALEQEVVTLTNAERTAAG